MRCKTGARWALLAIVAACGGSDNPLVPSGSTLVVNAGDGQSVQVAQPLAAPLAVKVADAMGSPIAGIPVTWTVASGGGTISAAGASGSDGVATAMYTAGTTSGPKSIVASVSGAAAPATFTVTVLPGAARRLIKVAGDLQTGGPAAALTPLQVQVVDTFGNAVPGFSVSWSVSAGGGSVAPNPTTSDASGLAVTVYTTGTTGGAVTITATGAGLIGLPVVFTETVGTGAFLLKAITVPANYGEHDQFARAGLLFLCAWNTGLRIYDVGDGRAGGTLANPVLLGGIATTGGEVHNAWWYWAPGGSKKYVFVGQEGPGSIGASSTGDIHVVDISNIANPVEVAFYHMTSPSAGTHNFWVDETNEILYAAYYNGGVVALNISGPLSGDLASKEIARFLPGGGSGNTYTWGVQLYNGSLYATDMLSGFYQLKLTGGVFSVAGGGGNVPERYGSDQWVANGYAYSGTWGNRAGHAGNALKIWQLNGTGAPVLVDSIITNGIGTVSDVEVSADNRMLMFSAESGSGAGIYFYSLVASAAHPAFIARYAVTDNNNAGIHTASFYETGGHRYVLAAKNPGASTAPAALIVDVTAINP